MKTRRIEGKVVVITGSSAGIGKTAALLFCSLGAKVVLNGRDEERLIETRNLLLSKGYNVHSVHGDLTDINDCQNLVQSTINKFGQIDVLINNVGVGFKGQFNEMSPEVFEKIFRSNSLGAMFPTITALPHLKKSKGSILFISSIAGLHGLPSASAYSAGKMTLTSFWQSLRIELASTGIHVGICYVSFTENDKTKRLIDAKGNNIEVPVRPTFMLRSQNRVAKNILHMIERRKSKMTLSVPGVFISGLYRYFPKFVLLLMIRLNKKSSG